MSFTHSPPSFGQDVLALARSAVTRWNADLDRARRADLRHHARQCAALPEAVRAHADDGTSGVDLHARAEPEPELDDAPASTHPRAEPREICCGRAAAKPRTAGIGPTTRARR